MKRHSLRRSIEPKEGHKTTGASKNIFGILYLMYRSKQGCGAGAGAGAGAAGADTFWSEPEPEPEPPKQFPRSRSRSRSRKKTGLLRFRKGIQLWTVTEC